MIRFACPSCQVRLAVDDKKAGLQTRCPKCGQRAEVPNPRKSILPHVLLPQEPPVETSPPDAPSSPPAELPERNRPRKQLARPERAAEYESDPVDVEPVKKKPIRRKSRGRKVRRRPLAWAALGVAGGVLVAAALAMFPSERFPTQVDGPTSSQEAAVDSTREDSHTTLRAAETKSAPQLPPKATSLPLTPDVIFAQASPAIVQVSIQDRKNVVIGTGSGFLASKTGLIVTNYHVIEKAHDCRISFADQPGKGEEGARVEGAVALDQKADLAIIKLAGGTKRQPLQLAGSDLPPVGTKVYALGLTNKLSDGLVSAHREIDQVTVIQTTAVISPEASGGPLFGPDGKVVGVTTFKRKRGENLSFAVPASQVAALLRQAERASQLTKLPLVPPDPITEAVERIKPQLRLGKQYGVDELVQIVGRQSDKFETFQPGDFIADFNRKVRYRSEVRRYFPFADPETKRMQYRVNLLFQDMQDGKGMVLGAWQFPSPE